MSAKVVTQSPGTAAELHRQDDRILLSLAKKQLRTQSLLLDQVQDALIVLDLEDRICFWSKGAERLYGWKADEVFGKSVYDFLLPSGPTAFEQQRRVLAETGEWTGELRQVTRAQRAIIVESRWTLQRDRSGRPDSVLIVNRDITETRMLEAKVLRWQRMESTGILSTAILRDLNNVLPAMLTSFRQLRQQDADTEDRTVDSSQVHAELAAQRITQLLSLASEDEEAPAWIDLAGLIAETGTILKSAFPKSITIETAVAPGVHTIPGNATHLYQVLLNLCLNARDAMPSGGALTIEATNVVLNEAGAYELPDAMPGEYVLVKVTDTGNGMAPEIACRIFEPFFTTTERDKGTGLGLFTVSRIVERYSGFIRVLSKPNQGTQFLIYLPACLVQ